VIVSSNRKVSTSHHPQQIMAFGALFWSPESGGNTRNHFRAGPRHHPYLASSTQPPQFRQALMTSVSFILIEDHSLFRASVAEALEDSGRARLSDQNRRRTQSPPTARRRGGRRHDPKNSPSPPSESPTCKDSRPTSVCRDLDDQVIEHAISRTAPGFATVTKTTSDPAIDTESLPECRPDGSWERPPDRQGCVRL
jgi:hypothetical protein